MIILTLLWKYKRSIYFKAKRFVISSDSSHDLNANATDDEVTSIIRSSMPPPLVLTVAIAITIIARATSTLVHESGTEQVQPSIFRDSASPSMVEADIAGPSQPNVISDSILDDPDVYRGMTDHLAPLGFFFQLSGMDYEQVLAEFNVRTARHVCFSAEIRMLLQHKLRGRYKFEEKCAMQANLLKERVVEIASLKAQISLKEVEATKAIRLRGQVTVVEDAEAARANELYGLREQNAVLEGQVAALEAVAVSKDAKLASSNAQVAKVTQYLSNLQLSCDKLSVKASSLEFLNDKLVDQIEVVQDVQVKVLNDRVADLDAELMRMALHLDEKFYPRYLTTILWEGSYAVPLIRGYRMGWRSADYVVDVNALRAIDFPFLTQLASYKDSSMSDLMDLLRLEGPVLSISDALVPIVEPLSAENLVGEANTLGVPEVVATTTSLLTTFVKAGSVSPMSHAEAPPSLIVFEKEVLDTTPEHTSAP
ncbi:hypothetical protein Tco_0194366 [Tanacetum coccineum]